MRDVLSHLQVAAVDVPRSLTRASLFGQLDSARIVHVHGRGVSRLELTRDYGASARAATEVARPKGDWAARSRAHVAKA
eukprot:3063420-Pleurochrysis_carterae.AAC.1